MSDLQDEFDAFKASVPRDIPQMWMPALTIEDGTVVARAAAHDDPSKVVRLGFKITDPQTNGRAMGVLRHSVWQALEMYRLGRYNDVRDAFE